MLKHQRPTWPAIMTVVPILLLDVIIIKSPYADNRTLFLMSAVSIPSLIIAIYNVWQPGHFSHLIYPAKPTPTDLKVQIGNDQCSQPYHALIFNIHSTEHSDLANTFIDPVKSKEHDYSQFSVAEGLETYRLATGCLVLQIRPGYQEYQTENGHFNSTALKKIAQRAEVKMIELTANPTFRNAEGMIHFLNNLREISGGKPIGIRLCIDDKKKFYQICHAARKTQLIPDFIVVEGCTKNINHPQDAIQSRILLYDALQFVSQTLQLYGLQNRIKVIADGKITSGVQILKALALGANAVCMEMPRYTAIGYAGGSRKVSQHLKTLNRYDLHDSLMKDTLQLMSVCGFKSVYDITLSNFLGKLDVLHSKRFEIQNGRVLHFNARKKTPVPG